MCRKRINRAEFDMIFVKDSLLKYPVQLVGCFDNTDKKTAVH